MLGEETNATTAFQVGQRVQYAFYDWRDPYPLTIAAVILADEGPDPITQRPHLWRWRIRAGDIEFTTSAWHLRPAPPDDA